MKKPLVSVVIPFYSEIKWLEEAINSVLLQTYENIEILLVNDGSKEKFDSIINDSKIEINVINKENGGPASARNLGIEKASGKYIAFLDSDDLWLPEKLSNQISFMEENNSIWSQHSYELFWDDRDKTKIIETRLYTGNVYRDCFISLKLQTSCIIVLRAVLLENNIRFPYDKRYGEDTVFYSQLAKKYHLAYINGVLSRFRMRGSNAGFRAEIQLLDRGETWQRIKDNDEILNILPKLVIFAYKLSFLMSNLLKISRDKYLKNARNLEFFAKLLYVMPYTIFRIYGKNTK
ncbi:glycosyltransferase family A protein [Labilibaculum manganireducens]|uniref:glycosyltransferase family 2 protein n=1 Tax=Labilibaculum manganireducens TaxID=1940525 RepID=UPI0029F478CC|nr:glycosyltransferase family A protein [Labilibaculum manganireducens]